MPIRSFVPTDELKTRERVAMYESLLSTNRLSNRTE